MSTTKKSATIFDDDFEVTYEEEIPFSYSFDTKPVPDQTADHTIDADTDDYRPQPQGRKKQPSPYPSVPRRSRASQDNIDVYDDDFDDNYDDDEYDEEYGSGYDRDYEDELYDDDYDSSEYQYDSDAPRRKRVKRRSPGRLLSPAKKAAKYGTKSIYRVARSVVRTISILIMAGTFGVLAYNFWRGAAPYGDPQTILTEKNFALAAYAAVAAVFLLFELVSFFWSLTKMRIREGRKVYREDTGRGLFSFIFIYIASYLSFLLCSFLPDTLGSYEILNGIKGALDVFGSLHNVLLGLCLAGAISCLVRRHMS